MSSGISLGGILDRQTWPRMAGTGFSLVPRPRVEQSTVHPPRLSFPSAVRAAAVTIGPSTASAPLRRTVAPKPKVGLYNGLNSPGMDDGVNSPSELSPPDSTGAIGPSYYIEMANAAIKVWTRTLNPVTQSTLQSWVGVPANTAYCDPQIQWDSSSNRWLFTFIGCNPTTGSSQEILVGWSKTANPSNLASGWCGFGFDTTPFTFDFPKLGHNSKFGIIGVNVFDNSVAPAPFLGTGILWWSKPANGSTTCPASLALHGSDLPLYNGDGSTQTTTAVPVNTTTGSANGYVVSAYDPSSSTPSKIAVWHLDSTGVLHQDVDVSVATYGAPAPAPQSGTSNVLDTGDGRITQAVGDPTSGIWTQHTVAGAGGRTKIAWYEIHVSGGVSALVQEGTVSSPTDFVFNGAISPRADAGGAAIVYNRSGTAQLPLIAAQIRVTVTTAGTMEPGELILGTSPAFDDDFTCNNPSPGTPCRWGDYAGASPDPLVKNVVWGTSEVNVASSGAPAWQDRNFALSFITAPHAPTSVTAVAHDRSARITWTPSTFVPSSPVTSYVINSYIGASQDNLIIVSGSVTSALFQNLTDGVTYTFTVIATNSVGDSPESDPSNAVTPTRAQTQSTAASAPRITATQSSPNAPPPPRP